jgi:SAM-dependent methyltransferase
MRRLPFPDGRFDLVACFFTSFGYFETPAEDAATLGEFARVMRPGGLLFLDLPNRAAVVDGLVCRESFAAAGRSVAITRRLERDLVVKSIRIATASEVDGLSSLDDGLAVCDEEHEERVRLYTLETLAPVLRTHGLETVDVLGDEHGGPYDPVASPRMSLLLRATRVAPGDISA